MLSEPITPEGFNLLTLATPKEGLFTLKLSVFDTCSDIFALITDDNSASFDNKEDSPIPSFFFPIFVTLSDFFSFVFFSLIVI